MTRIKRVIYCGWRGIDYLALETDKPLTAFLGENGAGKSTLAMALIYALMPDRRILNVRPITDIKDTSVQGQDSLFGRIDPEQGFAYVVLDIITRSNERLVAGVHLGTHNSRVNMTPFTIHGLSENYDLYNAFNLMDDDKVYTPELNELKRHMAQQGYDCHPYDRVGDYGKVLHDAGILPTPMYNNEDRELFARLLETSFLGGISAEIAKNLKHYLLPEAKHIPETVRRMHECTEDVLKTQRALNDAKRQLRLIQAAFVTGRGLISNSISYVHAQFSRHWGELENIRREAIRAKLRACEAKASITGLGDQLKAAQDSELHIKQTSNEQISQWELGREALIKKKSETEDELKNANTNLSEVQNGKSNWEIAAVDYADCTYDQCETRLELAIQEVQAKQTLKREDIRKLNKNLHLLQGALGASKVAGLASILNAVTLEEQLCQVSDADARSFEAALHGMTNGVIGVSPQDIAKIEPGDDLPDCFWIGERIPEATTVTQQGRWSFAPSLGGYAVLSDTYKATFGHEARKEKTRQLEEQIGIITLALKELEPIEKEYKRRHKTLLKNSDAIQFYLENKDKLQQLENLAISLQKIVNAQAKEITTVERKIRDEREDQEKKVQRFAEQKGNLNVGIARAEGIINVSTDLLDKQSKRRDDIVALLRIKVNELRECRAFLQSHPFFNELQETFNFSDPATYVATQTKIYSALAKALEAESPARIQAIVTLDIDQHSPTKCLVIWPVLMEILHDHVPSTLLDGEGENLLKKMEERRDHLFQELVSKQDAVKVQARNISTSINTQINSQKRQVNALSEMGRDLRFGKVEGIRITLIPKAQMIEVLQRVADESGLFANDADSLDEILAHFFKEALGVKLEGNEILDYRTFIDLKLEAKRSSSKDWVPAFSLSGGEAIGAGIAIVFMLFKALAIRGDHRPDQLTPVFIMDEINRIDPRGQRMVVELCEQNGIQLFVTGPEMVPAQNTRMYMLARSMDPKERVIPRELRGFAG